MAKREVVIVPSPGIGHLLSAGELAKLLIHREPLISVVVLLVSLPNDSNVTNTYVDSQSRDADPTRLTFIALPSLPPNTAFSFTASVVDVNKNLIKQTVLDRVGSGYPMPSAFILDMFCASLIDVANDLSVPSYIFFASGPNALNLIFKFQSLADQHGVREFGDPDKEHDIPGFRFPVPGKMVPGVLQDKGGSEMILNLWRRFRETKGILVNTYAELDSYGIEALMEQAAKKEIPAVYPVGPILELDGKGRVGSHKEEHDSIIEWLDRQPPSSVAFLCFGSMGSFDEDQVKEIANGLDRSGHRFLWSLRRPPMEGNFSMPSQSEVFVEALPEGFLERTCERGKIIGWAPQVAVLAHPAVGGFVSHCGWNSMLESMWFGVPMATWPQYAEQQLNAFTLVKELGVAVEIRMDYRKDVKERRGNFMVTAEEVENGVHKLMSMDEETRKKVRDAKDKGRKALQDGGSSDYWLGRFIANVLHNNVA